MDGTINRRQALQVAAAAVVGAVSPVARTTQEVPMFNPLDCEVDNEAMTCPHCKWVAPSRIVHRNCPTKMNRWPEPWQAGDWLAIFFVAAGVTPSRWNWARAKLGYTNPCRCGERQEQYNKGGAAIARRLMSIRQSIFGR